MGPASGCRTAVARLATLLSRCLKVRTEAPSSLPVGWITDQEALPWHPFDTQVLLHSSPRRAVCNWCQIAFSLCLKCVCNYTRVCMRVFPEASTRALLYVALSPFKIADKCRSLCLASLRVRSQRLGLQAVVQDSPHWKCDKSILYWARLMLFTEHHRRSTIRSQQNLCHSAVTNACVTGLAINP